RCRISWPKLLPKFLHQVPLLPLNQLTRATTHTRRMEDRRMQPLQGAQVLPLTMEEAMGPTTLRTMGTSWT
uniref:Uncharacterized protein n=1 Tax=Aegilops tauschii subsp. strangulata TaxID=200361 RepID=A0A453JS40_AEGTS